MGKQYEILSIYYDPKENKLAFNVKHREKEPLITTCPVSNLSDMLDIFNEREISKEFIKKLVDPHYELQYFSKYSIVNIAHNLLAKSNDKDYSKIINEAIIVYEIFYRRLDEYVVEKLEGK